MAYFLLLIEMDRYAYIKGKLMNPHQKMRVRTRILYKVLLCDF